MRHPGHVAVGVVAIGLDDRRGAARAECRAGQAVAGLQQRAAGAVLDQARLGVIEGPAPARTGRVAADVAHLQKVADRIVDVAFDIGRHRVAVARRQQPGAGRVVRGIGHRRAAHLAEMLAPGRHDQPVERVVDIVVAGLYPPVAEEHRLLRGVGDMADIAGRIVDIVQVLHVPPLPSWCRRRGVVSRPARRLALGHDVGEALGERVVAEAAAGAVAVVDALALCPGVVVDVGEADGGGWLERRVDERRRRRRALQPDVDPLQQVRLVEAELHHAELCRVLWAVET